MRASHLNKIADRVTRLIPIVNDTTMMRKAFSRIMPSVGWREVLNRVTDLQILALKDVPELITSVQELKTERSELRRQLLSLRQQLNASIAEKDGADAEREEHVAPGVGDMLQKLGYLD